EYDKKVAAAMPTIKTAVRAKKARRILVLSKTMGWYHSSIETAKTCFKHMGPQSGAFKVDFSDEASDYTSKNLKKYDAILFNNCTYVQEFFNAQQRQAVLGFVKNGGGFIGIHAAADCGTSARRPKSRWPEITELIGGAFNGHPWTNRGTYGVLNEDPKHPILKPLAGNNFQISDEFYKYKDYKRANQRVLLSIDMSTSYKKSGRADHDHALVWVKQYGKGRVFFSSLGHNEAIYYNPMILQMWLNGIQFALGDLSVATKALPQPEVNKSFKPKK
ncbi:MAG: ThuA domain-containing protein, partial [Lentisphaeraceae bacterium]|nr:ThuA domain-containing protein [Lentisphaeraceae bacterium]